MEWINRKNEVPKEDSWYIVNFVLDGVNNVYFAFYDVNHDFFDSGGILPIDAKITHWAHLPEPPKTC